MKANTLKLAPWSLAVEIAREEIGQKEVTPNRSPRILQYWIESGIGRWGHDERQPWCCTFVLFCLIRAGLADRRLALPKRLVTASCEDFVNQADRCAIRVRWQDARPGDVICYRPKLSHIGIVEEVCIGGLFVIEGNTSVDGSREGKEVCRQSRKAAFCDQGSVWALPVKLGL